MPKVYELREIKVTPRNEKEVVITHLKKQKIIKLGSTVPWILIRYIPYNKSHTQTPYLKSVKILTDSKIESAIFNFRVFKVDVNGKPGNDLLKNNLILKVKKGKSYPLINLESYKIEIPKEGLYIGIEWITTNKNAVEIKSTDPLKKFSLFHYQPKFGCELIKSTNHTWYFTNAKWASYPLMKDQYGQLAAEITLTN